MLDRTWHDRRPSHPTKPEWVVEAEATAQFADKQYSEAWDAMEAAGAIDYERLDDLRKAANEADQYLLDMLGYWHADYVPPSVMTEHVGPEHYRTIQERIAHV